MDLNITKLPKELLALIFENLTKANDRRRAAQVSKLFYDILRHQSTLTQSNKLWMTNTDLKASPIRTFENSKIFPFSKLSIQDWHRNVVLEKAFWSLHGHKINEISIDGENVHIDFLLSTLKEYFPNLKKLTIECTFSNFPDADNNSLAVSLPVEDLTLDDCNVSLHQVFTLLECSPLLKNLEISSVCSDIIFPQILPWLETIESSRLSFCETPLEKLNNLPIKVVISELTIDVIETPKAIREFFKNRKIEILTLYKKDDIYEYDENGEQVENDPVVVYFTRDQAIALSEAESIETVYLKLGVLEFEGSLDLLARLPGLNNITLDLTEDLSNPLYPFYWSLPESAQKIRAIYPLDISHIDQLTGLSGVTWINILNASDPTRGLTSDEIQTVIRNCPNLTSLFLERIDVTDANLIGHGDLLPISSLEKLKTLEIFNAPNITSEAFKSAFKFLNLMTFTLSNYDSSEEEPFNHHVAKLFTQNCPNLNNLEIDKCPINDDGFDYLIRNLPYLRRINIKPKGERHSLSKGKIEEMRKEFPYIEISFDSQWCYCKNKSE